MKALKLVSSTLLGRTRQAKLCGVGLGAAILVAFCGGPLRAGPGTGNHPGILPPDSTPGDLSYPQWHVAWWNWSMSLPKNINPNLQVDGEGDLTAPAPYPFGLEITTPRWATPATSGSWQKRTLPSCGT